MHASDCPTVDTTEFLLAALEQASEAVVIIDGDLHVSHFNAAAESIWGVAREDILGLDASCLGLTDLAPNSEITIRRADGSRLRASVSASRVEIGGRSSYMVFVRDITAEVERRERIALLNLVADKTTRAVVVTDRNLRVVYTNAAFSGMFGYSAAEAQGRQANQLLAGPLTDRKTLLRLRRRICDGCGDEEEVLAYDRNGDEIWVSATVKAFRNDRGRIKYVFALLSDISENKQLRSLQQLIMGALADELPITEIADQLCRRVEAIAPMSSLRCCTSIPTGWCTRWVDPACRTTIPAHSTASPLVRTSARAGRRRITASRYWPKISTPIRAGSRTRHGRSRSA